MDRLETSLINKNSAEEKNLHSSMDRLETSYKTIKKIL